MIREENGKRRGRKRQANKGEESKSDVTEKSSWLSLSSPFPAFRFFLTEFGNKQIGMTSMIDRLIVGEKRKGR